jgi:hypothetical protein
LACEKSTLWLSAHARNAHTAWAARTKAAPGRHDQIACGADRAARWGQQLQQTGMLFIIMQQVQPDFIMALQHSPQAWIIAAQSLSPLVQVTQTP